MPNLELARKWAAELVSRQGVSSPPIDAEPIARLQKVSVLYASFNAEAKEKVAAYCDPARVIYVNRDQPPEYKNYAIAHELGHFLLHPSYVESDKYQVLMLGTVAGTTGTDAEQEAHTFAAELLVPPRMLARFRHVTNPEELAARFVAPAELIREQMAMIKL